MPLEPFAKSNALSIGVELELQLVNLSDFDLADVSPDILELLSRKHFPGKVTPEITESMIEIATDIHTEYAGLMAQLSQTRDILVQAADQLNVGICGGGTHPFQVWSERRIFRKQRYQEASLRYGYLTKQFTIFGQHVHIGCRHADEALFLLHALNPYVAHFIALSASSPFVQGYDTRFHSARLNSVFAFPLSGRAPFILNWEAFEADYFSRMESTGIVKSMKDFYWDIRPKPEYGTIELRVCDTPLSVDRAAALACYLQALCHYLLERNDTFPTEDDYLIYNYNRFQACRFGLEGVMVHPRTYHKVLLKKAVLDTLESIRPYAMALKGADALDVIRRMVLEGNDAGYLRQAFDRHHSVEGMVDSALCRFREPLQG